MPDSEHEVIKVVWLVNIVKNLPSKNNYHSFVPLTEQILFYSIVPALLVGVILVYKPVHDSPEAVEAHAISENSDCADAQADLSFRLSHTSYCKFCREAILTSTTI